MARRALPPPPWSLLAFLLVLTAAGCATAGRDEPPSPPESSREEPGPGGAEPETEAGAEEGPPAEEPDPCSIRPEDEGEWIDWTRGRLYRSVCASARWLDGFFGDARFDEEVSSALYGRTGLGLAWSEYDKLEVPNDFRANIPLPNIDERLSVTVAREDEGEFVEDRIETGNPVPEFVAATEDRAWLAGLGYTPIEGRNSNLRYSLGVRIAWPPAPYVQARYRYRLFFSDRSALRLRQTLFWRLDDGFGATAAVDLERLLSTVHFVRWSNVATISEATEGVRWRSDVTLYHDIPGPRALAYTWLVRGESDAPVPLDRYSFRVVIRQQILREWLFLELGTGLSWPRRRLDEVREASWNLGVRLEVFFGQWPAGPLPGAGFD